MDISQATIWQQAAGDTNRDYSDLCLKWDVILNGPGDFGPWPECEPAIRENRPGKLADIRRFAEVMEDEDFVVLRRGTSEVLGVGQVVGEYVYPSSRPTAIRFPTIDLVELLAMAPEWRYVL